ncbi:MAG: class I SAM-dependent methyltransferase [Bryobacteraceae bacterium]
MTEIFASLPANSRVLDLGARHGSFEIQRPDVLVVLVDLEPFPPHGRARFVQADAARLPFANATFDLVIASHSLEHFRELGEALAEIGRVTKRQALLCIAVPDASTITDRIYRWLGRGGGHVNAFTSPEALAKQIEDASGMAHLGTKPLFSSLAFLNRRNLPTLRLRRMALFLGGSERLLVVLNYGFRLLDRALGTRLSLYGWYSFFGYSQAPLPLDAWANVCVRCGAGHPEARLRPRVQRRFLFFQGYSCPSCGAVNLLTPDRWAARFLPPAAP